jgi:hypothetical protein
VRQTQFADPLLLWQMKVSQCDRATSISCRRLYEGSNGLAIVFRRIPRQIQYCWLCGNWSLLKKTRRLGKLYKTDSTQYIQSKYVECNNKENHMIESPISLKYFIRSNKPVSNFRINCSFCTTVKLYLNAPCRLMETSSKLDCAHKFLGLE